MTGWCERGPSGPVSFWAALPNRGVAGRPIGVVKGGASTVVSVRPSPSMTVLAAEGDAGV